MQRLFERSPLRWMRRDLRGALLVFGLATFACGHAKAAHVAKAGPIAKRSSTLAAIASPQQPAQADEPMQAAAGFDKFFLHDVCTAPYPPQPDTCLHEQVHKQSFKFGGKSGTVYDVTLHIRGIFEPTTITGGDTPYPQHPYFKVGGTVSTPDWSHWEIEVSEPKQTYWLNHYPTVGHTIYKEDFEATIAVAAGATVVIRVTDGNDREIDNAKPGPDRRQIIPGVVDSPLSGQMLRLDVIKVKARSAAVPGEAMASPAGPDAEVKEFRFDELETRLRTMQPGAERDYLAGVLANRTGRSEDSIRLLNSALPKLRESQPVRAAIALEALADDYTKTFRYSDASRAYDELLTHFAKYSEWLPTEDSGIVHLLKGAPAQTITWQGPVRLKTERNPIGSRNAELTANGVREQWLLDTGATMSVVSRSFAQRLGLKPLPGSAQMGAGGTGIENPVQVALLPTLQMGGARLDNVVVMILDDANLKIGSGKHTYQINAIVGFPVFQALGAVTFLHDGEFEAGDAAQRSVTGARMYMLMLRSVVECEVEGKELPFRLDTGALRTELQVRYYELFHGEIGSWKEGEEVSSGVGGAVRRKIFVQPKLDLGVGDETATLKDVTILSAKLNNDLDECYGNLGQDFVAGFESFTLDFTKMTFSFGALLAAQRGR